MINKTNLEKNVRKLIMLSSLYADFHKKANDIKLISSTDHKSKDETKKNLIKSKDYENRIIKFLSNQSENDVVLILTVMLVGKKNQFGYTRKDSKSKSLEEYYSEYTEWPKDQAIDLIIFQSSLVKYLSIGLNYFGLK